MPGFTEISSTQLMRLIGTPDAPQIIDVSIDKDFDADPHLIPTARRWPHTRIEELAPSLKGTHVVTICQQGKKLSRGSAALLASHGIHAENLEGGNFAWRDSGLPRIPHVNLPTPHRWVTRHRPKIDRIACPWLIRRFVNPAAQFLFVAPSDVAPVAEKFDATPFDAETPPFCHHGEACTFDRMLDLFGLDTEPLRRLATVIRAADTNRHDLAPEAAGLLAISIGLSRAHRDDQAQLEAGLLLYDALYRWARDGQGETHDDAAKP
jgi:rhodanese-related sulfurtransferase